MGRGGVLCVVCCSLACEFGSYLVCGVTVTWVMGSEEPVGSSCSVDGSVKGCDMALDGTDLQRRLVMEGNALTMFTVMYVLCIMKVGMYFAVKLFSFCSPFNCKIGIIVDPV